MAERLQIYKCIHCGNIVEVIHGGGGKLVCCGENMVLQQENTVDAALEKHVPVLSQQGTTWTVTVGSVPHPMEEAHYIEVIELLAGSRVYQTYLKPGDEPKASFEVTGTVTGARAYCNLHGLWKSA